MKILSLNNSRLDAAVEFTARVNQDPEHNISYFGETETEIKEDFVTILPPEGYSYIAISGGGELSGLLGVEMDMELGRCWLLGPLVDHESWESIAEGLYTASLAELPDEIVDQEIYCGRRNVRVQNFALNQGFEVQSESAVLTLDVSQRAPLSAPNVSDFDGKFATAFKTLHEDLFPNTYYSAEQLIEQAEEPNKRLLVYSRTEKLAGYIFIQVRQAFNDGYIDFLGVDETFRRQGVGSHLVNAALNWAGRFPFVEKATITVNTENTSALQMYAGLGFRTESVSQSYRKRT
jgi:ribosomal protein S18 acetylase RimI-like enzyme